MEHLLSKSQLADIGPALPVFMPAFEAALAKRAHGAEPTSQELALAVNDAAEQIAVELLQARIPGADVKARIPGWRYTVGGVVLDAVYYGWTVSAGGEVSRHHTFLAAVRRAAKVAA